jgi:hypothetical protein
VRKMVGMRTETLMRVLAALRARTRHLTRGVE